MGGLGTRETFDNSLAIDSIRQQFLDKAKELNLEISSLAMTGFYAQSFAQRPTAVKAVQDCIATMKQMGVKVGFSPSACKATWSKTPNCVRHCGAFKRSGQIGTRGRCGHRHRNIAARHRRSETAQRNRFPGY